MAFAVMDTLRDELGLRIPDDVSIVSYDDVPEAGWGAYRLTTVAQSARDMVRATVEILTEQIGLSELHPRAAMIPARLVVRDSARLPPGRTRDERG